MAGKSKPKISGKGRNDTTLPEVGTLPYWRAQARAMCKGETDEWRISEVATVLNDFAKLLGGHWKKINTICHGNEDSAVDISFKSTIDRKNNPTEVSARIGYSQKFGESISGKTPDPSQTELPLETNSAVPEPEQ